MINGVQHNVFARRLFMIEHAYFLTSSLKKHTFYNWLINNILYLCVTQYWVTRKVF